MWITHPSGDQQEQELREAFDTIDLDKGGTIDMEELIAAFEKCLYFFSIPVRSYSSLTVCCGIVNRIF